MKKSLGRFLESVRARTGQVLSETLPGPGDYPGVIHSAMRYAISSGKRIRPALVYAVGALSSRRHASVRKDLDAIAGAIEMIHTYSLIHDDLPGMDDDGMRRGRPTVHIKFNEAIAILAGDALLTHAFEVLTYLKTGEKIDIIRTIARAAGTRGMIGGQVADIESEGRHLSAARSKRLLGYIHQKKTAALIQASVSASALACGLGPAGREHVKAYGSLLGLSFQIVDDILDVEGNELTMGKTKSDVKNRKLTFPAVYGLEYSKKIAFNMIEEAKAELDMFGSRAAVLREIADFVFSRNH